MAPVDPLTRRLVRLAVVGRRGRSSRSPVEAVEVEPREGGDVVEAPAPRALRGLAGPRGVAVGAGDRVRGGGEDEGGGHCDPRGSTQPSLHFAGSLSHRRRSGVGSPATR